MFELSQQAAQHFFLHLISSSVGSQYLITLFKFTQVTRLVGGCLGLSVGVKQKCETLGKIRCETILLNN